MALTQRMPQLTGFLRRSLDALPCPVNPFMWGLPRKPPARMRASLVHQIRRCHSHWGESGAEERRKIRCSRAENCEAARETGDYCLQTDRAKERGREWRTTEKLYCGVMQQTWSHTVESESKLSLSLSPVTRLPLPPPNSFSLSLYCSSRH